MPGPSRDFKKREWESRERRKRRQKQVMLGYEHKSPGVNENTKQQSTSNLSFLTCSLTTAHCNLFHLRTMQIGKYKACMATWASEIHSAQISILPRGRQQQGAFGLQAGLWTAQAKGRKCTVGLLSYTD